MRTTPPELRSDARWRTKTTPLAEQVANMWQACRPSPMHGSFRSYPGLWTMLWLLLGQQSHARAQSLFEAMLFSIFAVVPCCSSIDKLPGPWTTRRRSAPTVDIRWKKK